MNQTPELTGHTYLIYIPMNGYPPETVKDVLEEYGIRASFRGYAPQGDLNKFLEGILQGASPGSVRDNNVPHSDVVNMNPWDVENITPENTRLLLHAFEDSHVEEIIKLHERGFQVGIVRMSNLTSNSQLDERIVQAGNDGIFVASYDDELRPNLGRFGFAENLAYVLKEMEKAYNR